MLTGYEQLSVTPTDHARRLARLIYESIDLPLSEVVGGEDIRCLSNDVHLLQQVQAALRELTPNNGSRYVQALLKYQGFWREAVQGRTPYPQEIELHPSAYCPLDCWYCCSPNRYAREKLAPASRNDQLLRYACELAGQLETIQLSGGREPLEDGTLPELLEGLSEHRLAVRLNTSGYSSKPGRLNAISAHLDYAAISIDGHTSALYDQIKRLRKPGALDRVIENVRLAVANPRRTAHLEMVVLVLPENEGFLSELVQFAEEIGFDSVRFRRLKHHVVEGSDPPAGLDPRQFLPRLQALRPSRSSFAININLEDFSASYDAYVSDNRSPCYSSSRKIVIDALGYVYPCALHSYPRPDTGLGISQGDPINIRDHPTFGELWSRHASVIAHYHASPCPNCYVADRYINNFIARLADDDRNGDLPLVRTLFLGTAGGRTARAR